jgi:DNA-binding transcriptional MocR family regulator
MINRTQIAANVLADHLGHWQTGRGPLKVRLKNALVELVLSGALVNGDRLPPERGLASALAVSRNTVVAAYDLLREEGYLATRRASGSTIQFADAGKRVHERRTHAIESTYGINNGSQGGGAIDFAVADIALAAPFERYVREFTPLLHRESYGAYGLAELREAIAAYYDARGVPTSPDEVLITNGGQQAISLAVSLYVQRGDAVAVQNPTFFVALDALRMAGARLTALPERAAENVLRETFIHGATRLAYVIPTHQNPTGYTMPAAERKSIAKIADDLGIPVLEDQVLDELTYDGEAPAPIASYSRGGTIVCAGSLSKVFWSGLRVGWVRAPAAVIARLARIKTVTDLGNNIISQSIALPVFRDFDAIRAYRRAELREKLRFATALLDEHLPDWKYNTPAGGFCLWLTVPVADVRPFVQIARRFGVNIIAGTSMAIDESAVNNLRLVFSGPMETTREGIHRLARAWQAFTARGFAAPPAVKELVV